jgi:hypothetical protein
MAASVRNYGAAHGRAWEPMGRPGYTARAHRIRCGRRAKRFGDTAAGAIVFRERHGKTPRGPAPFDEAVFCHGLSPYFTTTYRCFARALRRAPCATSLCARELPCFRG